MGVLRMSMKTVKCRICDVELEIDSKIPLPGEKHGGIIQAPTSVLFVQDPHNSDLSKTTVIFGLWNNVDQKAQYICMSCICDKLGISDKKPRGGFF